MKKSFLILLIAFMTMFSSGCLSDKEKLDNARMKADQANKNLQKTEMELSKNEEQQKEWEIFKKEALQEMEVNQIKIDSIKFQVSQFRKENAAAAQQKMDLLQLQNSTLKQSMEQYKFGRKEDWESFKIEFKKDMNGLGNAIKNFFVNNKK